MLTEEEKKKKKKIQKIEEAIEAYFLVLWRNKKNIITVSAKHVSYLDGQNSYNIKGYDRGNKIIRETLFRTEQFDKKII